MEFFAQAGEHLRTLGSTVTDWVVETAKANSYLLFLALYTLVRATAVTVQSGTTGLLFSFGRARKVITPGVRVLLPFLQVVRVLPTRQRTMDLPAQRVTTLDGLVYLVDANLVYRIVDVAKALIEIDDLQKGMRQVLVLSVQDVLRCSRRMTFQSTSEFDRLLAESMAPRLAPWGVEIDRAGFTSITPSSKTLRLTQLSQRVSERRAGLDVLEHGAQRPLALALLGTNQRMLTRSALGREREVAARRAHQVERLFRRAVPELVGKHLDARAIARLRREFLADAGLGGVLGDTSSAHDEKPMSSSERRDEEHRLRVARNRTRKGNRVTRNPTGRLRPSTDRGSQSTGPGRNVARSRKE